jgi:hypothetical protein
MANRPSGLSTDGLVGRRPDRPVVWSAGPRAGCLVLRCAALLRCVLCVERTDIRCPQTALERGGSFPDCAVARIGIDCVAVACNGQAREESRSRMPRTTKLQREVLAAIAGTPFAPDADPAFAAYGDKVRAGIVAAIAADKRAGFSGNEMRAKYGERLTGPARRKLLREHGEDAGTIARSYGSYRDGDARQGTRHAREHGAAAQAARAEQDRKEAAAAKRKASAAARKARKAEQAQAAASAAQDAPQDA